MSATLSAMSEHERARLNDAWEMGRRAGVQEYRQSLIAALEELEEAMHAEQPAREAVRGAQAWQEEAVAVAEWPLEERFVADRNKVYLAGPNGSLDRAMTAEERAAWKRRTALHDPEVVEATQRLNETEAELAKIRARITVANARISALKHAVDASVALLNAFVANTHPLHLMTEEKP